MLRADGSECLEAPPKRPRLARLSESAVGEGLLPFSTRRFDPDRSRHHAIVPSYKTDPNLATISRNGLRRTLPGAR
jgi:hypothetical protein